MCVVLFLFFLEFHWCSFHSLYQILHCINCYIFIINHFYIVHVPFLFFSSVFGYSWSFALLHLFKNQFLAFIKNKWKSPEILNNIALNLTITLGKTRYLYCFTQSRHIVYSSLHFCFIYCFLTIFYSRGFVHLILNIFLNI